MHRLSNRGAVYLMITRRSFVKGLGGALVALSLSLGGQRPATAQTRVKPARLIDFETWDTALDRYQDAEQTAARVDASFAAFMDRTVLSIAKAHEIPVSLLRAKRYQG